MLHVRVDSSMSLASSSRSVTIGKSPAVSHAGSLNIVKRIRASSASAFVPRESDRKLSLERSFHPATFKFPLIRSSLPRWNARAGERAPAKRRRRRQGKKGRKGGKRKKRKKREKDGRDKKKNKTRVAVGSSKGARREIHKTGVR